MKKKIDTWGLAGIVLTIVGGLVQVLSRVVDNKTLETEIDEIVERKLSEKEQIES